MHIYFIDGSLPSMLYEDSGNGYDYENGVFAKKAFRVTGSQTTLAVSQKIKGTFTPTYSTYKIMLHGLPFEVSKTEVDGVEIPMSQSEYLFDKTIQVIEVDKNFQYLMVS